MAKCDQGYLCDVCGQEVKRIDQSELYLRYVIGWIPADQLHAQAERHLACSPGLSQFIVDPDFQCPQAEGPLGKDQLDADFRLQRETLVTRGYQRLKYLQKHRRDTSIDHYPLADEASLRSASRTPRAEP